MGRYSYFFAQFLPQRLWVLRARCLRCETVVVLNLLEF